MVETGAGGIVDAHVPFADEGGFVAGVVEEAGPGGEAVAGGAAIDVVGDLVGVRVEAGEEGGAAGGAERGDGEGVLEHGAFAGETVYAGGLCEGVAAAAELVPAEVVDQDEDDVWALGGLEEGGG